MRRILRNNFKRRGGHLEETCRSPALPGDSGDGPGEVRGFLEVHVAETGTEDTLVGTRRERGVWCGNGECGWLVPAVCGKQTLEVTNLDN